MLALKNQNPHYGFSEWIKVSANSAKQELDYAMISKRGFLFCRAAADGLFNAEWKCLLWKENTHNEC